MNAGVAQPTAIVTATEEVIADEPEAGEATVPETYDQPAIFSRPSQQRPIYGPRKKSLLLNSLSPNRPMSFCL